MDREQDIPFVYEDGVFKPEGTVNLPEGTRGIAHIRELTPKLPSDSNQFWHGKTVEQLAAEQNVKPIIDPNELRGDWPPEDSIDDFLKSLREGRR